MAIAAARRIAFEALLRVETQGAYADELLHARFDDPKLKREDAALATELVMGTLRWQRLLDFLLDLQLQRGTKKQRAARLDPEVRIALRMGLYQLRRLARVPAHAAVHESVELVKRARKASAAGLVNAVLRNAPRQPAEELVGAVEPTAERLAILHSHPTWLVERWLAALGEEETRALLAVTNEPPRHICAVAGSATLTAVGEELRAAGAEVQPGRWLRAALELSGGPAQGAAAFRAGRARMQDEASQMVALLLDVKPGMRVLDLCAAPGGKTLSLAEAAGGGGHVVAGDLHVHRLRALRERLSDASQVSVVALDATQTLPFSEPFDAILVDVPCSGTGTLARHPEIRWRLDPPDLLDLQARQRAMLENAAPLLRRGGRLVYSTCSLEPEENEQVVEAVLARHDELQMARGAEALARHMQPGADAAALFDARGYFRTWPHRHGTDGFFAAVLCKPL